MKGSWGGGGNKVISFPDWKHTRWLEVMMLSAQWNLSNYSLFLRLWIANATGNPEGHLDPITLLGRLLFHIFFVCVCHLYLFCCILQRFVLRLIYFALCLFACLLMRFNRKKKDL